MRKKLTARISDYKKDLYYRDYSQDVAPLEETHLARRIVLAAVPFISLHPTLRYPVSIAMGTLRLWNTDSEDSCRLVIAVIALAASVFQHHIGMCITTIQDFVAEINTLRKAEDLERALKSLVKIVNHLIYLALMVEGGLELSIVAFALQAVVNLIQSMDEFKCDRWIEGVANLLMAGVRLQQTHTQYQQLKRNWEIEAALKKFSVSKLHEKWQFPSDHLPVGVEVDGVKIISWNVLNSSYMAWVAHQDLDGSMISELNRVIQPNGLTMRDVVVAGMVETMMSQGHMVALQECSAPFLQYLHSHLPSDWDMLRSFRIKQKDQEVVLYNKTALTYQPTRSHTSLGYTTTPRKITQDFYFSRLDGQDLRIINAHIPGDPTKPGRYEFANYVYHATTKDALTIALGDYNFERHQMIDAFQRAGFTDFSLHSPYKTNIDPITKHSKGIDHIFVEGRAASRDLSPTEILPNSNLQAIIDLLNL